MVPKSSYPPTHPHPHLTLPLPPTTAQAHLAHFLTLTHSNPHLHPDALLSSAGISYSAQSGPTGGLAIHHLKRIEAGLRGENLVAETGEDLAELFGGEKAGDDTRVDALLVEGPGRRREGGLKRKRSTAEDVAQWAEASSEAAFGGEATTHTGAEAEDWQDREEYELAQQPMRGEVGERSGAPFVRQNGQPPTIEHVADDQEGTTPSTKKKKVLTDADKAARRAEKKQKNKVVKAEKAAKRKERTAEGDGGE